MSLLLCTIVAFILSLCNPHNYVHLELFAELSFKVHGVGVPEDLSLYHMVEKNTATGREEKNKFDELEVQAY